MTTAFMLFLYSFISGLISIGIVVLLFKLSPESCENAVLGSSNELRVFGCILGLRQDFSVMNMNSLFYNRALIGSSSTAIRNY